MARITSPDLDARTITVELEIEDAELLVRPALQVSVAMNGTPQSERAALLIAVLGRAIELDRRQRQSASREYDRERQAEVTPDFYGRTLTAEDIAEKLGVDKRTVQRRCHKLGIKKVRGAYRASPADLELLR